MRATFGDGLPALGREGKDESLLEFRDVKALFLEVGILAYHTSVVELGSTSPVGVATSNSG